MRRIALWAMLAVGCCAAAPVQAHAGDLTDDCRATPAAVVLQGPCRGAEVVASALAAHCRFTLDDDQACTNLPLSPRVIRSRIADHGRSLLHRQLASQHVQSDSVAFVDAPWAGTHNSFNSVKQTPALSETDANQQLTLAQQLDLDMRSLELDLHSWRGDVVLCHGREEGIGCTTERPLADGVAELAKWLADHPGEVLLVYFEDHLNAAGEARIPELVAPLRPLLTDGRSFPALTRDDVRAAGARVVLVGGAGSTAAWRSRVFGWGPHEWESRPHGFADCRNATGEAPPYDQPRLIRFFEDSTWLTHQAEFAGQSNADDGLRPDTVRAMVACGLELFGFDQLLPEDPRLPALVWSWGPGQDPADARCAVLGSLGRWVASNCSGRRPAACRDGVSWRLAGGRAGVSAKQARRACARLGAVFAAPRTARENAALRAVAGAGRPWLGVRESEPGPSVPATKGTSR